MIFNFPDGWKGVWVAYGQAGLLILDMMVWTLLTIFILAILATLAEELHLRIHKYIKSILIFMGEKIFAALAITGFIFILIICIAALMKGGNV